jgi:S1-C subfamily serine protease
MRLLLALFASVLCAQRALSQASPRRQATLSTEQLAARATPAVVLLNVFDASGRQSAIGSGFIAPDGRVVTNMHVVEGADHVEVISARGRLLVSASYAEAISTTVDIAILPAVPAPR